jgi:CHAD domain-containing protein
MAYELEFGLPSTATVRGVALERLDRARHRLNARPEGLDEAVHETRKDLKRFRALARLVRGPLPKAAYRRANGMARDAGRELSDVRDTVALLETADALDHAFGPAIRDAVTAPLRAALETERAELDDRDLQRGVRAALARLDVLRDEEVPSWTFDEALPRLFPEGLRRTYRRARAAMATARERPTTENLHEWRKRVKYHRYHLKLLRPAWHPVVQAQRKQVKDLSSLLGDDHDLAVLERRLDRGDLDGGLNRDLLTGLILERRAQLQREAFDVGELAFAEKPKALSKRLRRYAKVRAEQLKRAPVPSSVGDLARA